MNKKGFTLVELTISIALLSIVMLFMFNFLTIIKKDEHTINESTEMLLNKALIAKEINEDIKTNGGLTNASCTNIRCDITLKNGKRKAIRLNDTKKIITYENITDNRIELTKEINEEFEYNLSMNKTGNLTIIKIQVPSNENYNINIVDYQTN